MSKKAFSYEKAERELQDILAELEEGTIDIDLLSKKVQRASELIALCRDYLRKTQEEVDILLNELDDN
ncbi:MAG: exodeoxyribonuclease VII small subunit [Bacteroidetes bacterium]|jgi:exodeoxyribonuclease VII small subunit|nr:exodeoxyribonuclease VII small subunit [Bacteroidota bacterium]